MFVSFMIVTLLKIEWVPIIYAATQLYLVTLTSSTNVTLFLWITRQP